MFLIQTGISKITFGVLSLASTFARILEEWERDHETTWTLHWTIFWPADFQSAGERTGSVVVVRPETDTARTQT